MEICEIKERILELVGYEKGSVHHAAEHRAHAVSEQKFKDKMVDHVRACVANEHLTQGTTKADIMAKASEQYKQAISEYKLAILQGELATAEHQKLINELDAMHSLLIAAQTEMKHLR